jgi:mannose-6-phosphate isomerase
MLLDRFLGTKNESDGHFPEDWLASTVTAKNGEHTQGPDEGLARIMVDDKPDSCLQELLLKDGASILGTKHLLKFGANTAVLCKYLDSAVRLPIQCHPDVVTALKLFNSPFGKTECWHIISTRKINGEEPYILLGFKPSIKQLAFVRAVKEQDIPAMINMLHKIPVNPGDTYFVPARIPHAIGPGVFMLEVQEPSDWVIQPEEYCADIKLSITDMWGTLSPEQGLKVFDYKGLTEKELLKRVAPSNRILHKTDNIRIVELIGPQHTSAFGLWKVIVSGTTLIQLPTQFAIIVVEKGSGTFHWADKTKPMKQSDYLLKPANLEGLEFRTDSQLELLVCLPPVVH